MSSSKLNKAKTYINRAQPNTGRDVPESSHTPRVGDVHQSLEINTMAVGNTCYKLEKEAFKRGLTEKAIKIEFFIIENEERSKNILSKRS